MATKLIFIFLINIALAQTSNFNPIGLHVEELKDKMVKENSEFFFNRELELKKAKIVKYEDELQTKTLIYVFNKKDCCQYYMVMYDYMYYDSVVESFKNHEVFDENTWIEDINGSKYSKYIVKNDWYFTVITKKFENK